MNRLTDADVYAAIRYLDPGWDGHYCDDPGSAPLAIQITIVILLIACIAFTWLYVSTS